jgi:hypothetical protein
MKKPIGKPLAFAAAIALFATSIYLPKALMLAQRSARNRA